MELYTGAFGISVMVTAVLMAVAILCEKNLTSLYSPTNGRHHKKTPALRIGGVCMLIGFLAALTVDYNLVIDRKTAVFLSAIAGLTLWGALDDLFNLPWKNQLLGQILFVTILFLGGITIESVSTPLGTLILQSGPFYILGFVLMLVWICCIINAINWSDGVDGLSGSVSMIAAGTLFVLALRPEVYQPPMAIMAAALFGVVTIFTIVNILTGRLIAGSSGSYFMGGAIATLAIFAGAKIGTTLLVLIVPLVDAFIVLYTRYRDGVSIFRGDTRHIHHVLLARGWRQSQILLLYIALTAFGAILALSSQSLDKFVLFVVYGLFIMCVIVTFSFLLGKNMHIKKIPRILIISLCVIGALIIVYKAWPYSDRVVQIGGKTYFLQERVTDKQRQQGLSGRDGLCARCGMLFLFEDKTERGFWMKDMKFPIDIIWLDDGKIVHIEENVSQRDQEKVYKPNQKANAVLELPTGTAQRNHDSISIGRVIMK